MRLRIIGKQTNIQPKVIIWLRFATRDVYENEDTIQICVVPSYIIYFELNSKHTYNCVCWEILLFLTNTVNLWPCICKIRVNLT
jgi:hypothetical protein